MLPAALPYEYLQHIDSGDRVRRVRRVTPGLHERT
jgi:hypothetical protein